MKPFYWITFYLLLGFFTGCGSLKENPFEKSSSEIISTAGPTTIDIVMQTEIDVTEDIAPPGDAKSDFLDAVFEKVKREQKSDRLVIKRSKVGPAYKTDSEYLSMRRYERVRESSSSKNQGRLQIELARDIRPTIRTVDKPLALGGDGFDAAGLEADDYRLHFNFNSHMMLSPVYEIKIDSSSRLDPDLEEAVSNKFLIFHHSKSSFGRQPNLYEKVKSEQALQQKSIYEKAEAVPDTWVLLDQNKETKLHLIPSENPLDLIYDNPAILLHEYQVLDSDGS